MTATAQAPDRLDVPVLLSLADIVYILDGQVHEQTVYRWNVAGDRPKVMPEPNLVLGVKAKAPFWAEDRIVAFLKERGYKVPPSRLNDVRRVQGAKLHKSRAKSL